MTKTIWNPDEIRAAIEKSLRQVMPPSARLPADEDDWIESGILDSMAHVEFMLCVEQALNVPRLFGRSGAAAPQTILAAMEAIQSALTRQLSSDADLLKLDSPARTQSVGRAAFVGWGMALGSDQITASHVEREFSLRSGTLRERAGLESVRRAATGEDEASLARIASRDALKRASLSVQKLDWIVGTSETFQGFPSFAASLHNSLLAPLNCRVLDVGGGCVGLLNCLVVANSLLADHSTAKILVVSADVHSRVLVPDKIQGEFGGLFGDGACAFVLQRESSGISRAAFAIRGSIGACAGTYSSALQVRPRSDGTIALAFDGESLGHAAVDMMERSIVELEMRFGVSRENASAFAFHQPNHRLLEILVRRANLPREKVSLVAKSCGNLGASTCGVALSMALDARTDDHGSNRGPIFLVAVGPGLLCTGMVLAQASNT